MRSARVTHVNIHRVRVRAPGVTGLYAEREWRYRTTGGRFHKWKEGNGYQLPVVDKLR